MRRSRITSPRAICGSWRWGIARNPRSYASQLPYVYGWGRGQAAARPGRWHGQSRDRRDGEPMPAALTKAPNAGAERSRYQKLRPGVGRPNGLSHDQVVQHQRTRLYEAMVEITATRGYQATTIKALCALAGVSRQTFYDLFGADKEACFLGAYDYVVGRAVERINLAYRGEEDSERRLCRAFEQFALEAASEPQAARFALVETLGAGRAAFARMDDGRQMFEEMIAASISDPSDGATLSSTIAKGI